MKNEDTNLQKDLITLIEKDNGLKNSSKNKTIDGISLLKNKIEAFANIISIEEINNIINNNFESISDFIQRIDVPLLNKLFGIDLNVVVLPKNTALYLQTNWVNNSKYEANLFVEIESATQKEKIDFGVIRFNHQKETVIKPEQKNVESSNTTQINPEIQKPVQGEMQKPIQDNEFVEDSQETILNLNNLDMFNASIKAKTLNMKAKEIAKQLTSVNKVQELLDLNLNNSLVGDVTIYKVSSIGEDGLINITVSLRFEADKKKGTVKLPTIYSWEDAKFVYAKQNQSHIEIMQSVSVGNINKINVFEAAKVARKLEIKASDIAKKIADQRELLKVLGIDLESCLKGNTVIANIESSADVFGVLSLDIFTNTLGAKNPNKVVTLSIESWSDEQVKRFDPNASLLQKQKLWLTQTFSMKKNNPNKDNHKNTNGFFKKRKLKKQTLKNEALNKDDPFRKKLIQTLLDDPRNQDN